MTDNEDLSPIGRVNLRTAHEKTEHDDQVRRARLSSYKVLRVNSRRYAITKVVSIALHDKTPFAFTEIMDGEEKHTWQSARDRIRELRAQEAE